MRVLCICVTLIIIICRSSDEITFVCQKGIFSKFNLCKNSPPIFEVLARSSIECFTLCQTVLGDTCMSFKYERKKKLCSLYKDIIRRDFNEFANGSCFGYQTLPGWTSYVAICNSIGEKI